MEVTSTFSLVEGLEITGEFHDGFEKILTKDAQAFIIKLHQLFNDKRKKLLDDRQVIQKRLDEGHLPDFYDETQSVRNSDWQVASLPPDLLDRRVEITGPVNRKMVINALNSGAKVFMADFEDSNSPSWFNNIDGQINLRDAVDKTITFVNPKNGKNYQLNDSVATLMLASPLERKRWSFSCTGRAADKGST